MSAFNKLNDALIDRDSLSADVSNTAIQQQADIKAALLNIYKNLDAGAEYVEEFRTRADAIKPMIQDLLIPQEPQE